MQVLTRASFGILFYKNSVNSSIAMELNTALFRGDKLIKIKPKAGVPFNGTITWNMDTKDLTEISSSKVWNHEGISKIPSGRVGAS